MVIPEEYKTDHLFLLVGSNPVPVYVSYKLLARANTHIILVGTTAVASISDRLRQLIPAEQHITQLTVNESSPFAIHKSLESELKKLTGSIGLNYTGGTKAMAVHAYQSIQSAAQDIIYSYLDARTLQLVFERPGSSEVLVSSNEGFFLDISDLLQMHGYTIRNNPQKVPLLPEKARILIDVVNEVQENRNKSWSNFKKERYDFLINNLRYCSRRKRVVDSWDSKFDWTDALNKSLPKTGAYGEMRALWGDAQTFGDLANAWKVEPKDLAEWLHGLWLEHYTLDCVQKIKLAQYPSLSFQRSLEAENQSNRNFFELDVVGLKGYQLLVFSCGSSDSKGELKLKLFEAYSRAVQIGGDEARVALVCGARKYHPQENRDSSPERIQQEVEEDWGAPDRIRVFGQQHLADLTQYIQAWLQ